MNQRIEKMLEALDIPYRWISHPPVFTVEESRKYISEKRPIKNLLLQEKKGDRLVLVIMSGDERLNLQKLAAIIESRKLRFASSETLNAVLRVTPGSVSIFGLLNDTENKVEVVLDKILLAEDELGFHPNENTSTIFVPGFSLKKIVAQAENRYKIIELSE